MLGLILNILLACLGTLALSAGIAFRIQEKDSGYYGDYVFVFGLAVFLTCFGYAIMGVTADLRYAFIPRLVGLYGIDSFLLAELAFLLTELNVKKGRKGIVYGFFDLFILLDLVIFGRPSTLNYIRYDFHTAYENNISNAFFFHYSYIIIICITLLFHGVKWYKTKKAKRDKRFVMKVIMANLVLLFASFPDMFNLSFVHKYPTVSYSVALFIVYFCFWLANKRHILFTPTIRNVSQEIFYSVDVPVLIIDMEGKVNLFNPCAEKSLSITDKSDLTLRSLFTLTDVEFLRMLFLAKSGKNIRKETKIRSRCKPCILSLSTKLDYAGEPFCIICTVLANDYSCLNSESIDDVSSLTINGDTAAKTQT